MDPKLRYLILEKKNSRIEYTKWTDAEIKQIEEALLDLKTVDYKVLEKACPTKYKIQV